MNTQAASGTIHTLEHILFYTLLQIVVIIIAARFFGMAARRVRQPRAVGEIVAGLVLGPSLFGLLAPEAFTLVFRSSDALPLSIISQIGLILLMFQIGLEFDFSHLRERHNQRAVTLISLFGILAPFILGVLFGQFSAPFLAAGNNILGYTLFLAVALSITAVPILGRIMMEFDLTRTRIGAITISCAAINDVIGWTLLAVISAIVSARFSLPVTLTCIGGLLLYVLACWSLLRPLLKRLVRHYEPARHVLPRDLMAILLAVIFISAMVTSRIGIFAIFGGFMIGVLLHDEHDLVAAWQGKVADLVTVFFLPIFFTFTGLRTNIGSLDSAALWGWCGLLLFLAVLGKYGGCYLAARLANLSPPESRNIAIMMNTRALMELIVLNIGYDLGVIPAEVFTMLVLMAIISTIMAAPGLRLWLPGIGHAIPIGRDA